MRRRQLFYLMAIVALLVSMAPAAVLADSVAAPSQQGDSPESLLEQAMALAAEQSPAAAASAPAGNFTLPAGGNYPLFMGVDDAAVPAYLMDVTNSNTIQAFVGAQVWGSAYDAANDKVYFNNGSTLYEWPVGGAISSLGTMTDPAGATQAMVGLAFYNGTLYGIKNIANEAIYAIDTTTRVATVYIDYTDGDFDLGGFAADPNTGTFYATNDDTTPHGSGLFRMNADGTGTLIAPYPTGQTDIDGLAVSHDGYAYLVIDEPGNIYVWDFSGAAYATPLTAPWTSSEVFSGGAWIPPATPDALACNGAVVGFEDGLFPTGWYSTTLALPGGEWVVSMDNSSFFFDPGPAPEGVYYASANDDLAGSGSDGSADFLYTNIIDLSGYSSASLDFAYYFDGIFGQAAGGVEVSGDGGATWDGEIIVPTGVTWLTYTLDLSAYAGNSNVQVRFHSDDGGNWGSGYAIDAVSLDCGQAEPPNIYVDPLSMASTQPTNVQMQQTLTISNTGGGTLNWVIDEEDTALPQIESAPFVPQPAVEAVGAPEGTAPAAAPGKVNLWRGPEAVLYDNGPLVTHPGGGSGGADASAVQTALGNSTYGFGHAVSSGFRVADDFVVPAGGWTVNQITFFAYQTGSTTTSTINAVNLRIWDGPPNGGGSVIWGDTTTNRLSGSSFSNIYRVLDSGLTNNQRPIMADVATVGVFLPAGTYWLDWQTGGTLTSGPWAPPVTILGQTAKPGANGLQYDPTAGAWNSLTDTGAAAVQDLPFIIEGTAGAGEPCTALADIPWLTLSPTNGANAGGTNTQVTVTFDSTSLANGVYTGNLCITSNDPDAGPGNETDLVVVPVTLTVQPPTAVTLTGLSSESQAASPAPLAGLPLAALPAAAAAALGAAFVWRRQRN